MKCDPESEAKLKELWDKTERSFSILREFKDNPQFADALVEALSKNPGTERN